MAESDLFELFEREIVNWHGQSMVPNLTLWDGRVWVRKAGEGWPEVLAYRLGRSWLNIAEAVPGADVEGATHLDGTPLGPLGPHSLIRLGQDYEPFELPIQELDEAIASELVFSLWIRRRDAHPWNRVYLNGVPIFFDHQIAFGTEQNHRSLDGFFEPGYDGGYASHWRVQLLQPGEVPTTLSERRLPPDPALHRVRDRQHFNICLRQAADRIAGLSDTSLFSDASIAGVPDPYQVADLLIETRYELPRALTRLQAVISQPL